MTKEIDEATKNRLQEAANLKGIEGKRSRAAKEGATNVYVGVHGQDGTARRLYYRRISAGRLFCLERRILTFLASDENVISVLEKDADSAFMD